jgi:RNA polymerase sigma factor (sigma-70 family)
MTELADYPWGELTNDQAWAVALENDRLARKMCNDYVHRHPSIRFEEFLSAAQMGLFKAALSFDPAKGTLGSHLAKGAWFEMIEWERREGGQTTEYYSHQWVQRYVFPAFREGDDSTDLDDWWEQQPDPSSDFAEATADALTLQELWVRLQDAIAQLLPEDQVLIDLKLANFTFTEIGEEFGLTKQAMEYRQRRAFAKLRELIPDGAEHIRDVA